MTGILNARRRAGGISFDELASLCSLAHAHDARVYVTMNVVVAQDELAGAVDDAVRVLDAGADALIIQDWGFLVEVRRWLPGAEIHVSTQANVHDARGVSLCEELGASRVTLSRELPLEEIAAIAGRTSLELEVFSHRAICPATRGYACSRAFCAGPLSQPWHVRPALPPAV